MSITMTASAITSTRVRVTFTPDVDPANLNVISHWSCDGGLVLVSATPEPGDNVGYVDLATREQIDGQTYELTLDFDPEVSDMPRPWNVLNKAADYEVLPEDGRRAWVNMTCSGGNRQVKLPLLANTVPGDEVAVRKISASNTLSVVRNAAPNTLNGGTSAYTITGDKAVVIFVANEKDGNVDWMPY